MTARPGKEAPETKYEIVVRGELTEEFVSDLGGCVEPGRGKTVIVIEIIDQSHLHGVLAWLQDRNIEIERVNPS